MDALCEAATSGQLETLNAAIKQSGSRPDSKKSQSALVCAVAGNHIKCVEKLLDWSVSPDSQDGERRRPLHVSCSMGYASITELLLKKRADIKVADGEGFTPLSIAVQNKQMQCCKVLLKAGAQLREGQTCSGLSKIVEEVHMETLIDDLKSFSEQSSGVTNELFEADTVVWQAQKEHMRLLSIREEQKAAKLVCDLDRRLTSELAQYDSVKKSEDVLAKELADLRVNLQTMETSFGLMRSQIDSTEAASRRALEEEGEADAEYKAMLGELQKTQFEKETFDKQIIEKEKARDEFLALSRDLQEEIDAQKRRNKNLADELKAESAELRGWERDKEAASALTEQAHNLLGTGPLSPKSLRVAQRQLSSSVASSA